MKHFCLSLGALLAAGLLAPPATHAQAPAWQAAQALSNAGGQTRLGATAAAGTSDVYLTGYFSGTLSLGATTLTSSGGYSLFVAKWNLTAQAFTWAQRAGGGPGDARGTALAVQGNAVYVAGSFTNSVTFGGTTLAATGTDLFVAKLTDSGPSAGFTWAQRAGNTSGLGLTAATTLAASGSNVYVAGTFDAAGPATFGATTLLGRGGTDTFVAKLTDAGSTAGFTWALPGGGSGTDRAYALAVNGASVYVAGAFEGSQALWGNTSLTSAGDNDVFVAKLTDAGSTAAYTWAQRAGGPQADAAYALAVNGPAVYVAGSVRDKDVVFGTRALTTAGEDDAFVAKLTDAGTTGSFTWAQTAGGEYSDEARALAVRGTAVYVAGSFGDKPATFGTTILTSAGQADLFAARLTDQGSAATFDWARAAGSEGSDYGTSLALGPAGQVFVGGQVAASYPAYFGSLAPIYGSYPDGAFIAALREGTATATVAGAAGPHLAVAPIPAQGSATVMLPASLGTGPATLTLLDALGRPVRTQASTARAAVPLDLTGVAPGVYALRVAVGPATAVSRLVVQ